jgi:hypothetical protein
MPGPRTTTRLTSTSCIAVLQALLPYVLWDRVTKLTASWDTTQSSHNMPGPHHNMLTDISCIPVLQALLPYVLWVRVTKLTAQFEFHSHAVFDKDVLYRRASGTFAVRAVGPCDKADCIMGHNPIITQHARATPQHRYIMYCC